MDEKKFVVKLKSAAEAQGFKVMSSSEFDDWWKTVEDDKRKNYLLHDAEEAVSQAMYEAYLDSQSKYRWTDKMREISGFGGSYELACRAMVVAVIRWLDEHPDANPEFKSYEDVTGLITVNNSDAKELEKAVLVVTTDCTGAMFQYSVSHGLHAHSIGWDEYVKLMEANEEQ